MRHSRLSARTPKDEEMSIAETKLGFCFSCVIFRRAFASPFFLHFEPLCLCLGVRKFERRLRIFWSELIDRVRERWFLLFSLTEMGSAGFCICRPRQKRPRLSLALHGISNDMSISLLMNFSSDNNYVSTGS